MRRLIALLLLLSSSAMADVQVAFSPGHATQAVVEVISKARTSIRVAAYSFTSKPIADALVAARNRGVTVQAVLDKSNETGRHSAATLLSRAGIPVRMDDRYAIMHDKFIVVDGVTVETGSFNYTASAQVRNAENVIVLRDQPDVAQVYEQEWQRLWNESREYGGEAP